VQEEEKEKDQGEKENAKKAKLCKDTKLSAYGPA